MNNQIAKKHHYIPKFLLRSWVIQNGGKCGLPAYKWDFRKECIIYKDSLGVDGYGYRKDLLSLSKDKDILERGFFQQIDNFGAEVYQILLTQGTSYLTEEQRCHFVRLLISLEVRQPHRVHALRTEGRQDLADGLNDDLGLIQLMEREGILTLPSEDYEKNHGISLEDEALLTMQQMVDNPNIGSYLINYAWKVIRIGKYDTPLILSDTPLIRINGYTHPESLWCLPLTPGAALVITNNQTILKSIDEMTPNKFARRCNISSANQAREYIFSISDATWAKNILSQNNKTAMQPLKLI